MIKGSIELLSVNLSHPTNSAIFAGQNANTGKATWAHISLDSTRFFWAFKARLLGKSKHFL